MTEHLPIQRYFLNVRHTRNVMLPVVNERFAERKGDWVLYADHLAALRACEQRVQKIAYQEGLGAGSDEHGQHEIGWIKGYDAALDDAREALFGAKAIDVYYGRGLDEPPQFIWLNNALAAIDALREKQ